ncbi:MAG: hypothetical protein AAFR82_03360 [Pseudomonadota bacterium]
MHLLQSAFTCLAAISALALSPALACTCPPFEGTAGEHAEAYDFIGVAQVGTVFELVSEAEKEQAGARLERTEGFLDLLYEHVEAIESGASVPSLEELENAYNDDSSYFPSPYTVTSTLTQMKVKRVLKGEKAASIFVKSNSPGNPACGVRYQPETEIFLFAKGEDGLYSTWMCSGPRFPIEDYEGALETD